MITTYLGVSLKLKQLIVFKNYVSLFYYSSRVVSSSAEHQTYPIIRNSVVFHILLMWKPQLSSTVQVVCFISRIGLPRQDTRLDGSITRRLLAHSSGGWKCSIREPQGWFVVGPLFLACMQSPSYCPHMAFPLRTCRPRDRDLWLVFLFKDTSPVRSEPRPLGLI